MQTNSTAYTNAINSIKRQTDAYIEVYYNNLTTTPRETLTSDNIVSIEISRAGEQSKFFGFGVSQKATIKLLDKNRDYGFAKGYGIKIYIGVKLEDGTYEYKAFPRMWMTDVVRDETSNALTITAYDMLETALLHTVNELEIEAPYTIKEFAETTAKYLDGADRNHKPLNEVLVLDKLLNEEIDNSSYWSINERGNLICNAEYSSRYTSSTWVYFGTFDGGSYDLDIYKTYMLHIKALGGEGIPTASKPFTLSMGASTYTWNSASLSIPIAYDSYLDDIYVETAKGVHYEDLEIQFSIEEIGGKAVSPLFEDEASISALSLSYENGANFEGTETLREALNAIAEATQTIYYMGADDLFHFKRLATGNKGIKTLDKNIYMNLKTGDDYYIKSIVHVTELGDNLSAEDPDYSPGIHGIQYVRNNPFWELRDDAATLIDTALAEVYGIGANQFECEWRGDPSLEPGDRISFELGFDEGYTEESYLLSDTLTYNGGLRQKTEWSYTTPEQAFTNPTSLGDVIKQTYAKVDKQNKEIEIVAGEASENKQELAALKINTESISASVSKIEEANTDALASINGELVTLTKKVETAITAEDVQIQIKSEISNGVDKVTTATGFTFNEDGLTIAKTGSEMTTNIDEDGMSVYRDNQEVLTADNQGVIAYNLKAKTYLIVGENSRFEDFTSTTGEQRTGCFWIGG